MQGIAFQWFFNKNNEIISYELVSFNTSSTRHEFGFHRLHTPIANYNGSLRVQHFGLRFSSMESSEFGLQELDFLLFQKGKLLKFLL